MSDFLDYNQKILADYKAKLEKNSLVDMEQLSERLSEAELDAKDSVLMQEKTNPPVPETKKSAKGYELETYEKIVDGSTRPKIINTSGDDTASAGLPNPSELAGIQKLNSTKSVPVDHTVREYDFESSNKINDTSEGVYQPVGAGLKDVGEVLKRATSIGEKKDKFEKIESTDLMEFKTRTEKSITNDNLAMFVYSLVPYIVGKTAESISTVMKTVDKLADPNSSNINTASGMALGAVKNVLSTITFLSYFTTEEMAWSLTATPFTLGYLSSLGIQTKDKISSVKWSITNILKGTAVQSWNPSDPEANLKSASDKNNKDISELYKNIYASVFTWSNGPNEYNSKDLEIPLNVSLLNVYQKQLNTQFRDKMRTSIESFNKKNYEEDGGKQYNELKEALETLKETYKNKINVGYIYVYPSSTDNDIAKFKIPFQFNPILNEGGQQARYEGVNVLHRQGQAFAYVQTEGQTLSLETEYLILNNDEEEKTDAERLGQNYGPQDAFYSAWSPNRVRAIERSLRSLVLPITGEGTDFHKPPMVKIVMDDSDSEFYGLLKYPLHDGKYYHRTYIITRVAITREQESPYYISKKGLETHGFKVSMELTEIDHNYVGAAADFNDYYKTYKVKADSYIGDVDYEAQEQSRLAAQV